MKESRVVEFLKNLLVVGELTVGLRQEALDLLLAQPSPLRIADSLFQTREGAISMKSDKVEAVRRQFKSATDKIPTVRLIREITQCGLAAAVDIFEDIFGKPLVAPLPKRKKK